jgi:hypothetical protein
MIYTKKEIADPAGPKKAFLHVSRGGSFRDKANLIVHEIRISGSLKATGKTIEITLQNLLLTKAITNEMNHEKKPDKPR